MTRVLLTCNGDVEFKKRVKITAAQHGVTMAELVRKAVDALLERERLAKEVGDKTASFFATVEHSGIQSKTKRIGKAKAS